MLKTGFCLFAFYSPSDTRSGARNLQVQPGVVSNKNYSDIASITIGLLQLLRGLCRRERVSTATETFYSSGGQKETAPGPTVIEKQRQKHLLKSGEERPFAQPRY